LKKHSPAWLASILGRGTNDWMIALLYEAQRPLISERNRKRAQIERARQRALKAAAEYCGAGVVEVG
jgi:hypothetical protein